jgi:cold shock CspA family protein
MSPTVPFAAGLLVDDGLIHTGVVAHFDDNAGLGTVRTDAGDDIAFHCTAIADASRTIAVGTPVAFTLVTGHLGRFEAGVVTPMATGS